MSTSTTSPAPMPVIGVPSAITQATSVTTLVANLQTAARSGAQDVPDAVKAISVLAPDLAPKALIASKSPWGTLAVSVVVWASAHWGFGWSEDTCVTVAGVAVLAGSYLMRYITTARIGGVLTKGTAA